MAAPGGIRLETMTREECLARLAAAGFGRIGASVGALPIVLPVNYALVDDEVVFRAVPGTRFDTATTQAIVAFEIDGWAADAGTGWSVLLQGHTTTVDEGELDRMRALPLPPWTAGDAGARFVRIRTSTLTGRRFFSD